MQLNEFVTKVLKEIHEGVAQSKETGIECWQPDLVKFSVRLKEDGSVTWDEDLEAAAVEFVLCEP